MSGPVGVIGAGAWGSALAQMLAADGSEVILWANEAEVVADIAQNRRNSRFLPSASLAPSIEPTTDIESALGCDIALMVTPAQFLGPVLQSAIARPRDLILCSKGIEQGSARLMHDVAADNAPASTIAVLSGPTFAHEVAAGLPTAVTLACGGGDAQWSRIAPAIARPAFRPYYSDDLAGAEIGGAVKNVLAIACGVVDGLKLGQNARAALIARGYAEMLRFGASFGARSETLAGLCGLGDLVLTCSSTSSRNFSLGKALGEGGAASELMANRDTVAEGAHTAPVLIEIAEQRDIAMPICAAVLRILSGEPAHAIVDELLARPLRAEAAHGA
jgi:glycerol-3-phosphate dehydrogenase (NAD(P)+)